MLNLTLSIKGKTEEDVYLALGEAVKKIKQGYNSGKDGNKSGSYSYCLEGEEEKESMWYREGFEEAIKENKEGKWLKEYFEEYKESLKTWSNTLIGTEYLDTDISIEMSVNGLGEFYFFIEDEFAKEFDSFMPSNNTESAILETYKKAKQKLDAYVEKFLEEGKF